MVTAPPSEESLKAFCRYASLAGQRVLSAESAFIVHHCDADGIASACIAALALKAKGTPFDMLAAKRMDDSVLRQAARCDAQTLVFADVGSDKLNELNAMARLGKSVAVFDHHPPATVKQPSDSLWSVNPHKYSIDGSLHACSSSAAFLSFSEHVPVSTAKRMAQLALAGIAGDMQQMRGANALLLEQSARLNAVKVRHDVRLFGRNSRSLPQFLSLSTEPFLPGLSGSEKACALFLRRNGIPVSETRGGKKVFLRYSDLPEAQRKKLVGALAVHCAEARAAPRNLVGVVYEYPAGDCLPEACDAAEFATLLNACGKQGRSDAAVSLCLGERQKEEEALRLLSSYRISLSRGLSFARRFAEDLGRFYFIDGRGEVSDSVVGTVAGLFLNSGVVEQDKPVIAFSVDDETRVKASARATPLLAESGVDVGRALSSAAAMAGGHGNGHALAAGAVFADSKENVSAFLLALGEEMRSQRVKAPAVS